MQHKQNWKRALCILLLAVVCIGGSELAACRFEDPALYQRITGPVRRETSAIQSGICSAVGSTWGFVTSTASSLVSSLGGDGAEAAEDQSAGDPAATEPLPETDPSLTTLTQRGGQEILTGGSYEIVYYNQADPSWCDQPYGEDTLGKYGCGPSVIAMAVSSLTNQEVNPAQVADWASKSGYWARHGGSRLAVVDGAAKTYALTVESCPVCDSEHLRLELSSGKIAVALMSAGHFTQGGHFILLRGVTLDGQILIADPNSRERSLAIWDAQLILDELSASRNDGAPLWFLSPPAEG